MNKGSEFAGGLRHFGAGFSTQGLTDEVPSFEEFLEVHTLEEVSQTMKPIRACPQHRGKETDSYGTERGRRQHSGPCCNHCLGCCVQQAPGFFLQSGCGTSTRRGALLILSHLHVWGLAQGLAMERYCSLICFCVFFPVPGKVPKPLLMLASSGSSPEPRPHPATVEQLLSAAECPGLNTRHGSFWRWRLNPGPHH